MNEMQKLAFETGFQLGLEKEGLGPLNQMSRNPFGMTDEMKNEILSGMKPRLKDRQLMTPKPVAPKASPFATNLRRGAGEVASRAKGVGSNLLTNLGRGAKAMGLR